MATRPKTGGRQVGSTNRLSAVVRDTLIKGFNGEFEKISEYMAELDNPKEKLDIMMKVLPYLCSKVQDTPEEALPRQTVNFVQKIPKSGAEEEPETHGLQLVSGHRH